MYAISTTDDRPFIVGYYFALDRAIAAFDEMYRAWLQAYQEEEEFRARIIAAERHIHIVVVTHDDDPSHFKHGL